MPGPHSRTDVRKLIAFGSGVGIEIAERNLDVTAVRVRPTGIDVLGSTVIADFAGRPAADWGAEYAQFLKETGGTHLAATVLLFDLLAL